MSNEDPPGNSQNTKSARPKRGTATFRPSNRSLPDLINNPVDGSEITDECTARAELEKRLFITLATEITMESLITALLDFTIQGHSLSPMDIGIIRAIAILLYKTDHDKKAKTIATAVTDLISDSLAELKEASLKKQQDVHEEATQLDAAIKHFEGIADTMTATITTAQNTMEKLAPSLTSTQAQLETIVNKTVTPLQPATVPPRSSYSEIAAAHLPPSVERAVARASIHARQILLESKQGEPIFPKDLSHSDITKKMKEALANIRDDSTPEGSIRAVQLLQHGGLIVELDSEDLAKWIRCPKGRAALEGHLGPSSSLRDRTYPIVVQYIPTKTQIEREEFLRQVEKDNSYPADSLVSIRWIKPVQRRDQEQCKAFALLQVSNAYTANDILKEGICIDNQRFMVHKDKKEPIRCAKCQHFGHIACNCSALKDTCSNCGNEHRMSDCTSPRAKCCTNCRSQGHASWSRDCPEFTRQCEKLNEKHPENNMPYFPTELPWTQVINPSRPKQRPHQRSPSPPPRRYPQEPTCRRPPGPPRQLTQSTLPYRGPPSRRPSSPTSTPAPQMSSNRFNALFGIEDESQDNHDENIFFTPSN